MTTSFGWVRAFSPLVAIFFVVVLTVAAAKASDEKGNQRVIDFEDQVIEGVNRRSLESASQLAEGDPSPAKIRLFKVRKTFRSELDQTWTDIGAVR